MRRPTRTTLRTLRTSVMLARPSDASTLPAVLRRLVTKEEGMATAEYAIGTLAPRPSPACCWRSCASGSLSGALQSIIESALSV